MTKKNKVENFNSIIILMASIIALITSVYGIRQSNDNETELEGIKLSLAEKAEVIQEKLTIEYPSSNEKIDTTNFEVYGTYFGNQKDLQELDFWVFIQNGNGYILNPGSITFGANHKWYLKNVYLGITGKFTVLIAISNKTGTKWIQGLHDNNIYTFEKIKYEYGIQILDFVEIEIINNYKKINHE